jgi:phosphate transport system protein
MEVEIDRELSSIIARRQPTARDLRLLMAISKTTANLERVGDEANDRAHGASIIEERLGAHAALGDLRVAADLASGCCARRWTRSPGSTPPPRCDPQGGRPDRQGVRRLRAQAGHLHDGRPAHHLASLDLLFLAKAIERIGDHAKNIAEFIIYVVKGADVRHTSMEHIELHFRAAQCDEETPRPDRRRRARHRRTGRREPAPQRLRADLGRGRRGGPARDRRLAARRILLDWMLPGQSGLRWRAAGAPTRAPRPFPS